MQEVEVVMHPKPTKHMDLLLQHVNKEGVDGSNGNWLRWATG